MNVRKVYQNPKLMWLHARNIIITYLIIQTSYTKIDPNFSIFDKPMYLISLR